ncbi:hypothetical protein AALP_AA8G393400, partial [Arabis alpina]
MESNRETDPDKRERNDDLGAFSTDECDESNAPLCDEDGGDPDKVIPDELVGTVDENADELFGTEELIVTEELIGTEEIDDVDPMISTRRARVPSFLPDDEDPKALPDDDDPRTTSLGPGRADDADVIVEAEILVCPGIWPIADIEIVETHRSLITDILSFADDTNPNLPFGRADASSSSSSSDSSAFSDEDADEDMSVEVERTKKVKKVKKKAKPRVCPDPPGSSLSSERSLRHLRKSCGIPEEIVLVAPTPADRADAPPAGYMTLFENYFDQCLLWFPLPRFLMRFLAVHGVCLAQINPRGIRHLLGIYVLSRECGVDISTENLSYLTDFRAHGPSEELKYSVANSTGMALIAGFPSKDDHFEYRFFFAEISERTVEADCIDLVKTRWERRVKPTMPKVSKEFLAAMHKELSSGNGNWKRSFSRKRIERAFSAEILPRKVLGRGQARLSLREQIALEAAA